MNGLSISGSGSVHHRACRSPGVLATEAAGLRSIEFTNPDGLPEINLYRQVSVATGSRIVHVAGQVSWGSGEMGESDLPSQIEDSYVHIATARRG